MLEFRFSARLIKLWVWKVNFQLQDRCHILNGSPWVTLSSVHNCYLQLNLCYLSEGSPKYFLIMNQVISHFWWTTPKGHNKTCMFTYRYRWWSGMRYMWASPSVHSWGIFLDCCHSPPSALCPTELQRKQLTINVQHLHRETKCATTSGKFRRVTTLEASLFA